MRHFRLYAVDGHAFIVLRFRGLFLTFDKKCATIKYGEVPKFSGRKCVDEMMTMMYSYFCDRYLRTTKQGETGKVVCGPKPQHQKTMVQVSAARL